MKNIPVFVILLLTISFGYSQNPIITHMYTADPSAHVFEGRMYLYPSHDRDSARTFDMTDWHVFSSTDLVNWADHGVALALKDIKWARKEAWAPDCAYYNGRCYFYYPTDQDFIGVAVGENPEGPFTDPLGKPLITRQTPGVKATRDLIDPCIFIDDDGTPYLFFGQNDVNAVRLNDDMISFNDSIKIVKGTNEFFEAVWVHKYKDNYYMSYSGRANGKKIYYGMADHPLGPYEYKGVILDEVNSGTNHHSIVEYKGQWYLFYHNSDLFLEKEPSDSEELRYRGFRRSVCVDYLYYNEDGTIKEVIPTKKGIQSANVELFY